MFRLIKWENKYHYVNFNNVDRVIYKTLKKNDGIKEWLEHRIIIDFHDDELVKFVSKDIKDLDKILKTLEDLCT